MLEAGKACNHINYKIMPPIVFNFPPELPGACSSEVNENI
jgi:hypothetical protein